MPAILDITRPVSDGIPVWPGDAPCRLRWTMRRAEGASVNVAELCLSAHTGTHADGPYHVADEGARIGTAPLAAFLGPARVPSCPPTACWLRRERPFWRTCCWTGCRRETTS